MFFAFLRSIKTLFIIYLLIIVFISYEGVVFYQSDKTSELNEQSKTLESIAKLKENAVNQWYHERFSDSYFLFTNKLVQKGLISYLTRPTTRDSFNVVNSVASIYRNHDYSNLFILDSTNHPVINLNFNGSINFNLTTLQKSVSADSILFTNIYFDSSAGYPVLDVYIPVYDKQKLISTIVLKIEPSKLLYPTISSWYDNKSSGECFIASLENNSLVYLSPLKFQKNIYPFLQKPLTNSQQSNLKELISSNKAFPEKDYRNIKVLSVIKPVLNMPWFIITKIDMDEVYEPVEVTTLKNLLIFGIIIVVGGFLLIYYYKHSIYSNEKRLYETENKFKIIFEKSHSAVLILEDEKIIDCNPKSEKFFGLSKKELLGKHPAELSPEFQEDNLRSIEKAKQLINSAMNGNSENFEWLHKRNNDLIYADVYLSPITLDNKEFLIAFLYDITSRKKNELILKESKHKFVSAFKYSPEAMIITSLPESQVINVNNTFLIDTGFTKDEILGKTIEELKLFLNDEERTTFRDQVIKLGFVYGAEISFRKKNGEIINCIISSSVISVNGKNQLLSNILNITERKKIEEALVESEMHFRTLADSGQALIWSSGIDIKSNYFNKTWLEFTGHTLEREIAGGWNDVIHPDDIQKCYEVVTSTFKQHKKFSLEYRLLRLDGVYRWIQDDGSPRYNAHGKFIGYIHHCLDITDRKIAQEKLESAYTELKNLYDNLPVAVFSYDVINKKILQASKAHQTIFGYPPEAFYINQDLWFEVIIPEDKPIVKSGYKDLVLGKVLVQQYRIRHSNGNIEWIESRVRPIFDENGKMIQIDGTASNVTELKNTEQQIKLLSKSIEQSPVSVLITKPDGTIEYANSAFLTLTGYTLDEVLEKNPRILKSGQQSQEFYLELWHTILSGNTWQGEIHNKKKNGELYWENAIISPVVDETGAITNFVAVKEDITLKKKNEELIRLNEKKFKLVFDKSSEALFLTKPDGSIDAANPAACRMFQFTEEEFILLGRNAILEDFDPHTQNLLKLRKERDIFSGEMIFKKKNGERIIGEISSSIFQDKDGTIRTSMIIRDISERKKMEQELIESKEKAEESSRLKSSFLANMSHELRTPLTGILGYSELLAEDVSGLNKEMVSGIYTSGLRLLETIDSILDISRIEADKYTIYYSDFNLRDFIIEEVQLFKNSAAIKKLYLNLVPDDKDVIINSGKNILHSIFSNLINNAIKFTDSGGITIKYKIGEQELKKHLFIEVTDTGIGISEEFQQVIFEEFRQVSEGFSRSFEGNGLGLAITKKLVNLLNGKIELTSSPGKGTTFKVFFPISVVEKKSEKTKVMLDLKIDENVSNNQDKKRIMIVENDSTSLKLLKMFVKNRYIYDYAVNGEQALALAKKNKYDLFLMDINLGVGMDGMEVTKALRSIKDYKSTPIIAVTAFAMATDKDEFLSAGCDDYISKPFTREDLLLKIKSNIVNNIK
jgi:PAS domain S-box-containing protein